MWQKYAPTIMILIVVLVTGFLVLSEKYNPGPDQVDTGVVVQPPPDADVIFMSKYPGKLVVKFETEYETFPIKGVLFPRKAPRACANFAKISDGNVFIGSRVHHLANDALMQFVITSKELLTYAKAQVKADTSPMRPQKGDICLAFDQKGQVDETSFYVCVKDSEALESNYELIGKVTEGLDLVPALKEGKRLSDVKLDRVVGPASETGD